MAAHLVQVHDARNVGVRVGVAVGAPSSFAMSPSERKLSACDRDTCSTPLTNRILPRCSAGFAGAQHDDARLHRRVVEQVRPQPDDGLDPVVLDDALAHVVLDLAKEHAVREEDGRAAGLRVERGEDVLEEGIVGVALGRRAVAVAAVRVLGAAVAVPALDRVGRVGEDGVEAPQPVVLEQRRPRERVAALDLELFDVVQKQVHARDRAREQVDLLPIDADRPPLVARCAQVEHAR